MQPALRHLYTAETYDGNLRFSTPVAVFFDAKRKELYVADAGTSELIILTRDGKTLGHFPHHRKGLDQKAEPAGIAVDADGAIFVSDVADSRVYMYDYRGAPDGNLPMPAGKNGPLLPGKMALDAAGNLYIAMRNSGSIVVYGRQSRELRQIAPRLKGFDDCCDVAVDAQGNICALSVKGTPVRILDQQGKLNRQFGRHEIGNDGFAHPSGLDTDRKGRLWIVDSVAQVVKLFNPDGSFVQMFGELGFGPGAFFYPVDLCVDRETDTLFVLEKNGRRLQAFAIEEKP